MTPRRSLPASLVVCLAVAVVVATLSSCRKREDAPRPEPKPPSVVVMSVQPRDVPVSYEFIGQTAATRRVEVRARVPGFILSKNFQEGHRINEGDVLFLLDARPFEADLEVAKAELDQALAERTAAESDVERFTELLAADAGSQKEFDDAAARAASAIARIRAAEARINRGTLELGYTTIRSPLTGVAGAAKKDVGAYVDGTTDSLLVEVIETDPIDVLFTVSEREVERARRAQQEGRLRAPEDGKIILSLNLVDGTTYPFTGQISFADIQVDPATGSTRVRGEFPNPDGKLRPGQFVRGKLRGYVRPSALTVPRQAIVHSPSGTTLMVVDNADVVQPRPITLGEWIESDVVVTSGLNPGDRVIVDGLQRVAPGVRVSVVASPHVAPSDAQTGLTQSP